VQATVRCAARAGVTVSARSGAHSFDNQACAGDIILDVSPLDSFDRGAGNIVTFGSGHLHGQLYHKLERLGLVVSGGAENGVGTAGLWLGCGRGPLTSQHGLSCDQMRAIEYIDAGGNVRTASATHNADMFWMARGAGGEFPGIVTNFTAQARPMPRQLQQVTCSFKPRANGRFVIKEWAEHMRDFDDPRRKTFVHVKVFNGDDGKIFGTCFDCSGAQYDWMLEKLEWISTGPCRRRAPMGWDKRLLVEGWDRYSSPADLQRQEHWPIPEGQMINGGHTVDTYDVSDRLLDVLQTSIFEDVPRGAFSQLYLYGLGYSHRNIVHRSAAYGGRDAKWVIHTKLVFGSGQSTLVNARNHHRKVSRALDRVLPCKGFYNYADKDFTCAQNNDAWLQAHFSDVGRMQRIKRSADPDRVFYSRLH